MIYVVLGMHKSGTTLVSQILHRSGIPMGGAEIREDVGYDEGNKYERESTLAIDQDLLDSHGRYSLSIRAPRAGLAPSERDRQAMRRAIADAQAAADGDWGFKDPRTYLTYPCWAELLPEHRLIVVYRPVEELWQRYRPRDPLRRPQRSLRLVRRWCECYSRIARYLDGAAQPSLLLDYRKLMGDERELARLARFVGRSLADPRDPKLYRGRGAGPDTLAQAKRFVRAWTGLDCAAIAADFEARLERRDA